MRNRRLAAVLFVVACVVFSGTPSYSRGDLTAPDIAPLVGNWTLDLMKSGVTEPERRLITAGPGWMRVEIHREGDAHPPTLLYKLDGSRHVNPFGEGTATTEMWREGDEIVTFTVFLVKDRPVTVREGLHATAAGEMTAAVTLTVEHGYQGVKPALEKGPGHVAEALKHFRKTP